MEYPLSYEEFKIGLKQGELWGLECGDCGKLILPPSALCVQCGSKKLVKYSFKMHGEVKTFTVIRVPPQGYQSPYVVALVEIDEGPWIMGNIVDIDANNLSLDLIGEKVKISSMKVASDQFSGGERMALTFTIETS